jgi:hypothetical protein
MEARGTLCSFVCILNREHLGDAEIAVVSRATDINIDLIVNVSCLGGTSSNCCAMKLTLDKH